MTSEDQLIPGRHLTDEEINAILDGSLYASAREELDLHLAECELCRTALADHAALSALLGSLASVPVPRSFQLGEGHARRPGLIDRLSRSLLPMLPAMRA